MFEKKSPKNVKSPKKCLKNVQKKSEKSLKNMSEEK